MKKRYNHAMQKIMVALFFLVANFCIGQSKKILQDSSQPFVIGKAYKMHSKLLSEDRVLNIYLPDGYQNNDSTKYPVIYLLDGAADEDFIHVVGLVQFFSSEWVSLLPKSIVVGIANVDRKRDFTFSSKQTEETKAFPSSGHSGNFINFIEQELQPFVENRFRCTQSKTIIGESLGGLLATEILLKRPLLFNRYIIVSPSLWWDDGSMLNQDTNALKGMIQQPTAVYVGVGKEGLTPAANPRVMEVDANLLADKLQTVSNSKLKVFFDYLPQENHGTIMHQAIMNAFRLMATH